MFLPSGTLSHRCRLHATVAVVDWVAAAAKDVESRPAADCCDVVGGDDVC